MADTSNGLMYGVAKVTFKPSGEGGEERRWAGWMKTECSRQEMRLPLWM